MTLETRFISVNDARLGYEVRGEGSGKPTAIFVHGYGGRSTGEDTYGNLLRALAETFTVYALDLRGHGASRAATGWSLAAVADDVAAFARALDLVGTLYVGHSMGGFTGMFCAIRHPGIFSALCLIATASAEGGKHTPAEVGRLMVEHGSDRDFLSEALKPMYARQGDTSAHVNAATLVDRAVHEAYFAEYPERVIIDDIRDIEAPVLVLNGALDNVVPLHTQHATALALPNCKEVIVMTEGHMLPIEAPDLVAREIIAFWTQDLPKTFSQARRRVVAEQLTAAAQEAQHK